ncbi:MAG: hypothetical protein MZV64_44225 [Ignavibacteriales bacterium]|nr:hypothetical protein [Ignavibacteriales bacterium]
MARKAGAPMFRRRWIGSYHEDRHGRQPLVRVHGTGELEERLELPPNPAWRGSGQPSRATRPAGARGACPRCSVRSRRARTPRRPTSRACPRTAPGQGSSSVAILDRRRPLRTAARLRAGRSPSAASAPVADDGIRLEDGLGGQDRGRANVRFSGPAQRGVEMGDPGGVGRVTLVEVDERPLR